MAKAVRSTAKITVKETREEDCVVLTLSPMEAAALFAVCGRIMGGESSTVRGYTKRVYYALMPKVRDRTATAMSRSIKMDMDAGSLDSEFRPICNPEVIYQ